MKNTNNFKNVNKYLAEKSQWKSVLETGYTDNIDHAVYKKINPNVFEEYEHLLDGFNEQRMLHTIKK